MESTPETRARAKYIHDYLVAHPEEHSQRNYGDKTACGTTMCIAGNAIIAFRPDLVKWKDMGGGRMALEGWWEDEGDIDDVAGGLLGLNNSEQGILFYDMNNQRALEKLASVARGEDIYSDEDGVLCDCDACV